MDDLTSRNYNIANDTKAFQQAGSTIEISVHVGLAGFQMATIDIYCAKDLAASPQNCFSENRSAAEITTVVADNDFCAGPVRFSSESAFAKLVIRTNSYWSKNCIKKRIAVEYVFVANREFTFIAAEYRSTRKYNVSCADFCISRYQDREGIINNITFFYKHFNFFNSHEVMLATNIVYKRGKRFHDLHFVLFATNQKEIYHMA